MVQPINNSMQMASNDAPRVNQATDQNPNSVSFDSFVTDTSKAASAAPAPAKKDEVPVAGITKGAIELNSYMQQIKEISASQQF